MNNQNSKKRLEELDPAHIRHLEHLASGKLQQNLKIGATQRAVKARAKKIRQIFGAKNMPHAIYQAVKTGIIEVPERGLKPVTGQFKRKIIAGTINGKNQKTIAKEEGVSTSKVSQSKTKIIEEQTLENANHLAAYADQILSLTTKDEKTPLSALSKEDKLIMRLLGQSHSVGQIAERTGKSYYTIERRVSFLTELTGLDRRRIAIKFGDGKKHVNTPVELKSDEKQVLKAIINEKVKNAEISKETKFSTNKVDKILKRIREKTGIENNNQVAVNAIELLLEDSQKQ